MRDHFLSGLVRPLRPEGEPFVRVGHKRTLHAAMHYLQPVGCVGQQKVDVLILV
jgi:hypothetical protein